MRLPDALTVVQQRLVTQRLAGPPHAHAVDVVAALGAVQAQVFPEAVWSLAMRCGDDAAAVEAAFDRGDFLRTHVLRPTWHFVAREDIRTWLRATRARVHQANKFSYKQFGLDAAALTRGCDLLTAVLADGPLTRPRIAEHAGRAGLPTGGLPLGYVLMYAELEEVICSGPRDGRQQTYVLLDHRAPPQPDQHHADLVAEVVERYYVGHGPATVHDLTTWSGLTVADVRAALAGLGDRLATWEDSDGTAWYGAPEQPAPATEQRAYLIPMFDELGIGYRDLRMVFDADGPTAYALERPVVIGGRTVGSWRRTATARRVVVEVALFGPLTDSEAQALATEVDRFGASLGLAATLVTQLP